MYMTHGVNRGGYTQQGPFRLEIAAGAIPLATILPPMG